MNRIYIGIDVGGTNIKIMLMDSAKSILDSFSIPTRRDDGYEIISDRIIDSIRNKLSRLNPERRRVAAICMGLPGTVDIRNQKTIHLAYLEWNQFNPAEKLGAFFDCPTYIDNDGSLNLWGEYCYSRLEVFRNVILLTLGTGVGCGMILDGKLFRGSIGIGAELGHMTIDASSDVPCLCGKKGHFESFCSGSALIKFTSDQCRQDPTAPLSRILSHNEEPFDLRLLDEACSDGDRLAEMIFSRYNRYLAIGLANIMKVFNPELILLGGGLSMAQSIRIPRICELIHDELLTPQQMCLIKKTKMGSRAGMFGACLKAIEINPNQDPPLTA